ncbi:sensor histidine kinase [Tenggerimyces flavus]|uniref:histidine kinase n=1 Tax=Tenggerimyces flavus TaxID=1708749 RepID=A0ABV7Y4Z6_9ACTN|nr:histidine kinase [Tenggerimyces flavus]MBM7788327.1 signal transduction histidine kinase [Tenggerimyces flavus]
MWVATFLGTWWRTPPWRDRLALVLTLLIGALIYSSNLYAVVPSRLADLPVGWRFAIFAVACALQFWRASRPQVAFVGGVVVLAVDVLLGPTFPMFLVIGDLLYCVVLYGRREFARVVVVLTAVTSVTTAVAIATQVPDWRNALVTFLQVATVPLIPVWWALNVRQHRDIADAERIRAEQAVQIAELDRRAAVAAERARMARDLHDVIAGQLSAIAIQAEALLSTGANGVPPNFRTVLESVRQNSVSSLNEMRTMVGLLRAEDTGEDVDPHTSPPRLSELSRLLDSARAGGLDVQTDVDVGGPLATAVDLAAYRIVQEALTNALKHAPGSTVRVSVKREDDALIVEVVNPLARNVPASSNGSGLGLLHLRERAQAVGGTLAAGKLGDRWQVRAELPVEGRNP